MAASLNISSLSWILNKESFLAIVGGEFTSKDILKEHIQEEHVDIVFKALNQFFYWKSKLQELQSDTNVILTCLSPNGLFKPNIEHLHTAIIQAVGQGNISYFNFPQNSNFVIVGLNSPGAAQMVRQRVTHVDGSLTCFVKEKEPNLFKVRVLWAPPKYPLKGIVQSFKSYCSDTHLDFQKVAFENGDTIITNIVIGTILLKEGVTIHQVPHTITLPNSGGRQALIMCQDRDPMCLKCYQVGHFRKQCKVFRCHKCKFRHVLGEDCLQKSFATVASGLHDNTAEDCRDSLVTKPVVNNSRNNYIDAILETRGSVIGLVMNIDTSHTDTPRNVEESRIKSDGGVSTTHTVSIMDGNSHFSLDQSEVALEIEKEQFVMVSKRGGVKKTCISMAEKLSQDVGNLGVESSLFHILPDEADGVAQNYKELVESKQPSACDSIKQNEHNGKSPHDLTQDMVTIGISQNNDKISQKKHKRPRKTGEDPKPKKTKGSCGNNFNSNNLGPAEGICTRAASRALSEAKVGKTTLISIEDDSSITDNQKSNIEGVVVTYSDMENPQNTIDDDEDILLENSDDIPEHQAVLYGFSPGTRVKHVWEFVAEYNPIEVWRGFEDDRPNGNFGVAFNNKEDALAVLVLNRQHYQHDEILVLPATD